MAPIPYLSPAWILMLERTLREADRLGLGVDLTMGSGWPWGGAEYAARLARGVPIGTAWTAPYHLQVPRGILAARNTLRLRVLVVKANRIIDLERHGIPWRKFSS